MCLIPQRIGGEKIHPLGFNFLSVHQNHHLSTTDTLTIIPNGQTLLFLIYFFIVLRHLSPSVDKYISLAIIYTWLQGLRGGLL